MRRIKPIPPKQAKQDAIAIDPAKSSRNKLLNFFKVTGLTLIKNRYHAFINDEIVLSVPTDHKLPIEFIHEVLGEARYVLLTKGLETGASGNLQLKIYHPNSGKEISIESNQKEINNELVLIVDENIHITMKDLKDFEEDFIFLMKEFCEYYLTLV